MTAVTAGVSADPSEEILGEDLIPHRLDLTDGLMAPLSSPDLEVAEQFLSRRFGYQTPTPTTTATSPTPQPEAELICVGERLPRVHSLTEYPRPMSSSLVRSLLSRPSPGSRLSLFYVPGRLAELVAEAITTSRVSRAIKPKVDSNLLTMADLRPILATVPGMAEAIAPWESRTQQLSAASATAIAHYFQLNCPEQSGNVIEVNKAIAKLA